MLFCQRLKRRAGQASIFRANPLVSFQAAFGFQSEFWLQLCCAGLEPFSTGRRAGLQPHCAIRVSHPRRATCPKAAGGRGSLLVQVSRIASQRIASTLLGWRGALLLEQAVFHRRLLESTFACAAARFHMKDGGGAVAVCEACRPHPARRVSG